MPLLAHRVGLGEPAGELVVWFGLANVRPQRGQVHSGLIEDTVVP
jgi:hypothetical protein